MKDIETKLREGMDRNGIRGGVQDRIVLAITSFALYGFPESHAASFAMIAYASAYLKCHYLAAFTAALLNNQPMGFYHPSILIKDAQRHGLRVLPVDVTKSDWPCTIEPIVGRVSTPAAGLQTRHLRLGLRYVRGLRQPAAEAIVRARTERPFTSVDDLALRVPELRKDEMKMLAEVGALNPLQQIHRRDALWMAERAVRPVGPLLEQLEAAEGDSPLARMTVEERLTSDFRGTGVTIGRHPMAYRRPEMQALGVTPAAYLARVPNGRLVRIAGSVIVRQRPGTAKGFVFLSMEDETGVMNAIIEPRTYDRYKLVVVSEPFLLIDGVLQNQDGVISVKAGRVAALPAGAAPESHNFH
jgi:error-prone DNA polymerase